MSEQQGDGHGRHRIRYDVTALRNSDGLARWRRMSAGKPQWQGRSEAVAEHIEPDDHVLDIGSGARGLRDALPVGCGYVSFDIVEGATDVEDIEECDPKLYSRDSFDVAVFAGVVEFLGKPVEAIAKVCWWARKVIVTYDPAADQGDPERLALLKDDRIATCCGLTVREVGAWESHWIYEVRRI